MTEPLYMIDEPYWEMYRQWHKGFNYALRYARIRKANEHELKKLGMKHAWWVNMMEVKDGQYGPEILFPSREKAARFWMLSR